MKKITFTLLLILTSIVSQSQNLSMSELISLLGKDVSYVEEFLSEKGWMFRKAEDDDILSKFHNNSVMLFDYGRTIYDSDRAESFLACSFNTNSLKVEYLQLQVANNEDYLEYMKAIKGYGCKLISSSYMRDGLSYGLRKLYRGKTKTFRITTVTTKDEDDPDKMDNYWSFVIMSNKTYNEHYPSLE